MSRSCLIVGAGISGLAAAATLRQNGWQVTILDKGRGPGGRLATRRAGQSTFDHGAQFFTVRDDRMRQAVAHWEADGIVTPWFTEGGHVRYRGVNGMTTLAKHLAAPFAVRQNTQVKYVEPAAQGWLAVTDDDQRFLANALLLTAPAEQSASLLARCASELEPAIFTTLKSIEFDPCFALLATLHGTSLVPPPGYFKPTSGPIEWIADNTQKGISTGPAALTIHSRADFSREHFDAPPDAVTALLLEAAHPWTNGDVAESQLHRWRYSKPVNSGRPECIFTDTPAPLAIAGDAFGDSRVEAAFLSGLAAAAEISRAGSLEEH